MENTKQRDGAGCYRERDEAYLEREREREKKRKATCK